MLNKLGGEGRTESEGRYAGVEEIWCYLLVKGHNCNAKQTKHILYHNSFAKFEPIEVNGHALHPYTSRL